MKFTTREMLLVTLAVALGLGWCADRYVYVARTNRNRDFAEARHWQATTLWNWAKNSNFVKSIESDERSIKITTTDGKVEVFPVPQHMIRNATVHAS